MTQTDSKLGRTALAVAQCAGMVDLVALPVWVGALIQHYKFDPQQAGLLVTLFLVGAVLASITVAPRFHRLSSGRGVAVVGFAVASGVFFALSRTSDYGAMAALHGVGGLAIGAVLSVKDGTIARSQNPHRLFALCGAALGVFALVFLGAVPPMLAQQGGQLVFQIFGTTTYLPYSIAGSLFVAVMLFTHVFGFGLLARMETTGRALAATPAMMMSGAAIGPVLGGTLVKFASYQTLGMAAVAIGVAALLCFSQLPRVGSPSLARAKAG